MNSRALRTRLAAAPLVASLLAAAPGPVARAQADDRAPALAEHRARIVLRPSAALPGSRYALGDVADVDAPDRALRERLSALPIGALPRQGYADTVTRAQLQARVRSELRLDDLQWSGANEVRVRGLGQRIDFGALADAAALELARALDSLALRFTLRPVGGAHAVAVPAGAYELAARPPANPVPSRRMSVLVDVRVDGAVYTTVPVWFAVSAVRGALVARAPLRAGEPLRPEDFVLDDVDVTRVASAPLPAHAALGELRARRALEPGTPLAAGNVEARPAVVRDERVAVLVERGPVTIETQGVATADARLGELVRVQNTDSRQTFAARVVGPGRVLVGAR